MSSPRRNAIRARPTDLLPPASLCPDQRIRWLAGRQHDVVSHGQLLAAGLSAAEIKGRVRRGALARVHRGVFALTAQPLTPRGRYAAAVLAGPGDAVLSHRSAAELHGMLPARNGAVHVTTAERSRGRPGIVMHRSRSLDDAMTSRDGIACTTVPRTLVDLAAQAGRAAAARGWSNLAGRRALDVRAVDAEIRRHPSRPGTAVIRALVDAHRDTVSGTTRSTLEALAVALCRDHRLPMPRVNALLTIEDETYEIDLLWRDAKLAVEVDSWGTHGDAMSFRNDRARDFALQTAGWAVVRLLPTDLEDHAAATASKLRALLDRGGRRGT